MGNFDEVWRRIRRHKVETFIQVRGGELSYRVEQEAVVPDRTNYSFH